MSNENPYQVSSVEPPALGLDNRERLRSIATAQRRVNYAILAYFCLIALNISVAVFAGASRSAPALTILTSVMALGVLIFGAVTVYWLAALLHGNVVAVLYVVGLLIPCVGLLLLLLLSQKATSTLQAAGVRVGLLGADPSTI